MTEALGRDFGRRAVDAALAGLERFCQELPPAGPTRRQVRLVLLVAQPLPAVDEQRLREDARRTAKNYDNVEVEVSVPNPVGLDRTGPDGFRPRVRLRDAGPDPAEAEGEPVAQDERRLLTLTCEGRRLPYLLTPGTDWIPVRRADGPYDSSAEIIVPGTLSALSRTVLVALRLDEDCRLVLLRTAAEPLVTVTVDTMPLPQAGRPLPAERPVPDAGTIAFADRGQSTELDYALTGWTDAPLEPGTGRTAAANPEPYRTVIDVEGRLGWLDVQPPPLDRQPIEKTYAVPAPRFREGRTLVRAEVLYTRATSSQGGLDGFDWHVKLYRTATPQHAAYLRGHFTAQAEAVERVISSQGWRTIGGPWGIAPVHVPDPEKIGVADGTLRRTEFGARPLAQDPPDGRYGDWFGVPGGASSDCFVVVCSPWIPIQRLPDPTVDKQGAPALLTLPRFAKMAAALDGCHGQGIAHCDLKPDNMRMLAGDYVVVDADSVTELKSQPYHLPFTPPYARSPILRWHRSPAEGREALTENEIRDHDRFCFGALVLAGLAGTSFTLWVMQGRPGQRKSDSPAALRDALRTRWGTTRWTAFIDVVVEPFGEDRLRDDWTCSDWLARVQDAAAAAGAEQPAGPPVPPVRTYSGAYDREIAGIRSALRGLSMGRPQHLENVDRVIEDARRTIANQARRRAFALVGGVGLVVFVLFLIVFLANVAG